MTATPSHSRLTKSLSLRQSLICVTTDGQSASLCVKRHLGLNQIFVTIRQLRVRSCGAPSLTKGRVCRLQLLQVLASAVIYTAVKISSTCHLYLQFYMAALYIVSCKVTGSFWIPTIYSFTCKSSKYIQESA
jgi:hypothetical protein